MDSFEQDTARAWERRIFAEWNIIQDFLSYKCHIYLDTPSFEIIEKKWGKYNSAPPTICLSRYLFNNLGWGSVALVLRHETAHYIVDKVWNMGDLDSHGEAFKKACDILQIDSERCTGIKKLLEEDEKLINKEKAVEKIKKVMALTSSSAQGEAETALKKAQELMLKYNIDSLNSRTTDEYLFRPVGPLQKNMHNYVRDLANVVAEFYFVKHILTHVGSHKCFEFFGTKENLDVAEYIFCCLLRQGEKMWKDYAKELKKAYGGTRGMASKSSFLEGVYSGYRNKLLEQKKHRENNVSMTALIWSGDPLIDEMYKKAYPRVHNYKLNRNSNGGGFYEGYGRGKNLSIHAGITTTSNSGVRGRLITA